jgi:hypothetical protein
MTHKEIIARNEIVNEARNILYILDHPEEFPANKILDYIRMTAENVVALADPYQNEK